jgi:hypothetical protein
MNSDKFFFLYLYYVVLVLAKNKNQQEYSNYYLKRPSERNGQGEQKS